MQGLNLLSVVPIRIPWQIDVLIFGGFAFLICVRILPQLLRSSPRPIQITSPDNVLADFELKAFLLSDGEHAFLPALEKAIGNRYRIAMKVRLGDLVAVRGNGSAATRARNKTWQKHVDFILCDHYPVRPRLAIELDDKTHASRQERDDYVDQCLACAGLPILHVRCQQAYDVAQLATDINAMIALAKSR
jgi:Protein of unknown function (DUF2726)